jgi:hypothetical protein
MRRRSPKPLRCRELIDARPIEPLRARIVIEAPALMSAALPRAAAFALALFALACASGALRHAIAQIDFNFTSSLHPTQSRPGVSAANPHQAGNITFAREPDE